MTTRISAANLDTTAIVTLAGPTVSNIQVTDSSYTVTSGNLSATTGGYATVTGSNFASGCQVLVERVPATAVTFVSSTQLNIAVAAQIAGTRSVFIINPDGAFCTGANALSFN
jgi:expansin (peptidoglycan-binding protein)